MSAVSRLPIALALLLAAAMPSRAAAQAIAAPGQAAWKQDFEGPANSWSESGGDAAYTLVAHQRVRGGAHGGQGCEWIQITAQGGSTIYFSHDVGRPSVIEELRPALWVNSDRPGIQFLAEVTLPRTRDPRTGKPLTTYISGSTYTTPNRWQQLEITGIPRALQHQVFILRSQLSMNIDSHEAFVSRVLLNVYCGPVVTNVWTDDLEVVGHVPVSGVSTVALTAPSAAPANAAPAAPVGAAPNTNVSGTGPVTAPPDPLRREVKLAGSVLKVNEYPIFPRAVEYRGERLTYLKQLGFNTIWLRTVPTREFLWEARQVGLWLVSPPPEMMADQAEGAIGPEFEPVLAWDLGHGLTGETLDANRRRAEQVRLADSRFSRPLICAEQQLAELQPPGQHAVDRSPATGHEPGNARLRHLGPPPAAPGAARHSDLDYGPNASGRGPSEAACRDRARAIAADRNRLRANPASSVHGYFVRQPRTALSFRFIAGGPGRPDAAARHGA